MLTVFTPTYNRVKTISRLYDSLEKQSSHNFNWIIVDDGSEDETESYIQSIIDHAPFKVTYVKQDNSGKHSAINKGISLSNDEWFFIVDSDDVLPGDSISKVTEKIALLDSTYSGVCFRKADLEGNLLGTSAQMVDYEKNMSPTEAGHLFKGDLAYIFRSESMKKYPFPIIKGEKFVPELYIWNKIGDCGKIKFFGRDVVYLCEYLDDGYSQNFSRNLLRNPKGFSIHYRAQISREYTLKNKLKNLIRYLQCECYILRKKI